MKTKFVSTLWLVGQWIDEFLLLIITTSLAFITPIGHWIAIVGFFVISDTITAIIAAAKSKKEIQSRKLFRTISKFIVYGIAVIIAELVRVYFFNDLPTTKLMTSFIAVIELKSMDENFKIITGKSFFKPFIELMNKKDNNKDYNDHK